MSGPLDAAVSGAIEDGDLLAVAVVSSNRNFAGRVHPHVRAAYLCSPALTVAYALAGSMRVDVLRDPLGIGADGRPVRLPDLWPSADQVDAVVAGSLRPELFAGYDDLFDGGAEWESLPVPDGDVFPWDPDSTYIRRPPYVDGLSPDHAPLADIRGARPLAILGDSVTTDDISPSGAILPGSAGGDELERRGVASGSFNSYGTRRGNHEVAVRSLFANPRLRNAMVGVEGSITRLYPEGERRRLFDAALEYRRRGVPLVVVAGRNYGCGSSRDWAAKAPALMGVRAVIAAGFERIHRSNLVGMGILPLQLPEGVDARTLGLDGSELFDLHTPQGGYAPGAVVGCTIRRVDGRVDHLPLTCCLDTGDEAERLEHGGVLPFVWRRLVSPSPTTTNRVEAT
jgi:aconitate hydratase